jgi:hypothetical protein
MKRNWKKEESADYCFTDSYKTETRLWKDELQETEEEEEEENKRLFHEIIWFQVTLAYLRRRQFH